MKYQKLHVQCHGNHTITSPPPLKSQIGDFVIIPPHQGDVAPMQHQIHNHPDHIFLSYLSSIWTCNDKSYKLLSVANFYGGRIRIVAVIVEAAVRIISAVSGIISIFTMSQTQFLTCFRKKRYIGYYQCILWDIGKIFTSYSYDIFIDIKNSLPCLNHLWIFTKLM